MLSLVLPTYNESANITSLVDVIDAVLQRIPHEIIIVDDDSPDGTWRVAQSLMTTHPSVRVLRRTGRRGLSSAVTEGFDMAKGDVLAVMDADGQHDSELLVALLSALEKGADMAIGSRYVKGGSVGDWVTDRRIISGIGTILAHKLSRVRVSDPLGGFFALRRTLYKKVRPLLRPAGFKILLEILANVPASTKVVEVPLIFRMRLHGNSKLSIRVHAEFLWQVLRLGFNRVFRSLGSRASFLFWVLTIGIAAASAPRAVRMLPLIDANVRVNVTKAMQDLADKNGWLISDLSVLQILPGAVSIRHHPHLRTPPDDTVCLVTFSDASISCDN